MYYGFFFSGTHGMGSQQNNSFILFQVFPLPLLNAKFLYTCVVFAESPVKSASLANTWTETQRRKSMVFDLPTDCPLSSYDTYIAGAVVIAMGSTCTRVDMSGVVSLVSERCSCC